VNSADIRNLRLQNQKLINPSFNDAASVVGWLGAVQAQDYSAAKWAIGLRIKSALETDIEEAFNQGKILRTHIMRPTWHFVLPDDIRWMLALTTPRVKKILGSYDRRLELDEKLVTRCKKILTKALQGGKHLTRTELADELAKNKIAARTQRLAHILAYAELDAILCSGPRRGKQFTYALLDERVPNARPINRDEALAKLAQKYFISHGPAQIKDFSWWSGLSTKDSNEAVAMIKSKLIQEAVNDKTYWMTANSGTEQLGTNAFLLSIYDEYTIAYRDRSDLSHEGYFEKIIRMGNAFTAVVIIDGQIAGTWKRKMNKGKLEVSTNLFRKLNQAERKALQHMENSYLRFFNH
jgi:winged helix DNA-binding protein